MRCGAGLRFVSWPSDGCVEGGTRQGRRFTAGRIDMGATAGRASSATQFRPSSPSTPPGILSRFLLAPQKRADGHCNESRPTGQRNSGARSMQPVRAWVHPQYTNEATPRLDQWDLVSVSLEPSSLTLAYGLSLEDFTGASPIRVVCRSIWPFTMVSQRIEDTEHEASGSRTPSGAQLEIQRA